MTGDFTFGDLVARTGGLLVGSGQGAEEEEGRFAEVKLGLPLFGLGFGAGLLEPLRR